MSELARVHDRLMIIETLNRYAWGYDTRDLELMGGSFAADGSFHIVLEGSDGWGPYAGREAIVAWLAQVMSQQHDQRRHCVTNIMFRELDAERAMVDSYLCLTAVEGGTLRVVCTGTYHDEMRKHGGKWYIQRKLLRLDNAF
ncbi:MAG: nuclear transport factor 2 family protein [Gammaproteobacteria bacterium]|nr:nuclear transport factor 2 family protein [Gammaproteobacteria bacterium]